eukprot:709006-Pyramimonas_sp.AAC.1
MVRRVNCVVADGQGDVYDDGERDPTMWGRGALDAADGNSMRMRVRMIAPRSIMMRMMRV